MSDLKDEIWVPVPGCESYYSVSNQGRVRSEKIATAAPGRQRGRILTPSRDTKGYPQIRLCVTGRKPKMIKVHRVVTAAFVGPCPDGMQVNHLNGEKTDNRVENLEYTTCILNIRHSWNVGLHQKTRKGESNNAARLTAEIVFDIRREYPAQSLRQLAKKYGVSAQAIQHVVKHKTWTHV